jgi:hypothetical protein
VVWAEQFGTRTTDSAADVAITSTGISYVVGTTFGALGFSVGISDGYLRKYSASGVVQWTRQFGTTGFDSADAVTLDSSGNVYVLSAESDARFRVRKFSAAGTLLLTITNTTLAVSSLSALGVDSTGNIFVLTTFHSNPTYYARVFKYNSSGGLVTQKDVFQAVSFLSAYDLIVDSSNNLYISVFDSGTNRGGYVRKLTNTLSSLWAKRIEPLSTGTDSRPEALALDSSNNVYVTGGTDGAYTGFSNAGSGDIFALKLASSNGARLWTRQFGGNNSDEGNGIAVSDAVYVTGYSFSNLNLIGQASYCNCTETPDAFLAQLSPATGAVLGIDQ